MKQHKHVHCDAQEEEDKQHEKKEKGDDNNDISVITTTIANESGGGLDDRTKSRSSSIKHVKLVQQNIDDEIMQLRIKQEDEKAKKSEGKKVKATEENERKEEKGYEEGLTVALMENQKTFHVNDSSSLSDASRSKVVCGKNHTLLSSDGEVYSCGQDVCGQLGHEGEQCGSQSKLVAVYISKRVYDIAAGGDQSCLTRLGQLLLPAYQESVKENGRQKLFDIDNTDLSKMLLTSGLITINFDIWLNLFRTFGWMFCTASNLN